MIEISDSSEDIAVVNVKKSPLKEVVSPSAKKRKLDSPIKLHESSLDDGSVCSICLDHFNCSGEHRTVALKCGHLYGNSCISKWIQDNKSCPSCKNKATVKDFRFIYAAKVQVIDNSREVELEIELKKLQREKTELSATNSSNVMTIALQKRQIKELSREIERLKSISYARSSDFINQSIRSGRMYLEKTIDFKENPDCRIMKYMTRSKKLIISQKALATSLFAGYGVRFVDVSYHRSEKFINTSSKQIIDLCFDPTETYVATASREPFCKVYNINTSQTVALLTSSTSVIWSCAFNKNHENQILLGAQDGSLYLYDIKKPNEIIQTLTSLNNKSPVKMIISMNKNETFQLGGFFVIHARGIYFYEYKADLTFIVTKLNYDDSIVTASYDEQTEQLLFSTPPTDDKITHILMKLIKVEDVPVLQEQYRFQTNQSCVAFITRSAQIKIKDSFIVASYSKDTKDIQLHTPNVGKLHTMIMQSDVLDICPIDNSDPSIPSFAALSSTKCRIFKINLQYE